MIGDFPAWCHHFEFLQYTVLWLQEMHLVCKTLLYLSQGLCFLLWPPYVIGQAIIFLPSRCPHNMVNLGPLAAEIGPVVWSTAANFSGFRILAALLHGTAVVGVSQTLRR